jgi:hypothetical protein
MITAVLVIMMWLTLLYCGVAVVVFAYHLLEEAIERFKDYMWKKQHSKR